VKKALFLIGAFGALALLLAIAGALLPVGHTAAVQISLAPPPPVVYEVITDVSRSAGWRSDLDSIEVLSPPPPLRWREHGPSGAIEFLQAQAIPPRSVRTEIQGAEEQGFGGSWTWDLVPAEAGGTTLTITERGQVYNPLFRLLSRTVFSPYATLERYARDLAAHLGDDATPERVPR